MDPSTQLVLSVVTLLLTPFLSALVVAYQLSKDHSYWKKQQQYLRDKERFELRVDLLKRASSLLNRSNDTLIQHHIYTSSRDLGLALAKALNPSDKESAAYYQSEYESFRTKASESYLEWRALSSQLSELAAESSVYFSLEIGQKIITFRDKGNAAIASPLSATEIHGRLVDALRSTQDVEASKALVAREYDSKTESRRPVEEARQVLAGITNALLDKGTKCVSNL